MAIANIASGINDSLEELVKRRLFEQMQAAQIQHLQSQDQADRARVGLESRRVGQGDRSLDQSASQFDARLGFDKDEFGFKKDVYNQGAGQRSADLAQTTAETGDILRRPAAEELARGFTTQRDKTQHGYRLGEIGAQNAGDLQVAGLRTAGTPQAPQQNEIEDTLALIEQIQRDPSLAASTGPLDSRGLGMVTDTTGVTRVNALHNQLVGKMSLAQAGKLKGQGQISDKERALLRDAATALTQHMGDADYLNELGKVRSQFEHMRGGPAAAHTGGTIRARDQQGNLHEAPAGTALPQGWVLEK